MSSSSEDTQIATQHAAARRFQWPLFLGLIALAAATRLLPHPPNLTALGAVALFAGVYVSRWQLALLVPLIAVLIGDLILPMTPIGNGRWTFPASQYALFGLTVLFGFAIRTRPTAGRVVVSMLAATVLYYVVSNFFVWYSDADGVPLYAKTSAGLVECYIAALPFARNMVVGNLFYAALLFGGWRLAAQRLGSPELTGAESSSAKARLS